MVETDERCWATWREELVLWMISAEQRCAFRDIELRQEAEPVEPNNDAADVTQEMEACDSKRERSGNRQGQCNERGDRDEEGEEGSWV